MKGYFYTIFHDVISNSQIRLSRDFSIYFLCWLMAFSLFRCRSRWRCCRCCSCLFIFEKDGRTDKKSRFMLINPTYVHLVSRLSHSTINTFYSQLCFFINLFVVRCNHDDKIVCNNEILLWWTNNCQIKTKLSWNPREAMRHRSEKISIYNPWLKH